MVRQPVRANHPPRVSTCTTPRPSWRRYGAQWQIVAIRHGQRSRDVRDAPHVHPMPGAIQGQDAVDQFDLGIDLAGLLVPVADRRRLARGVPLDVEGDRRRRAVWSMHASKGSSMSTP